MIVELIIGLIICGILIVFLNPTHLLMPESLNAMLMIGLILAFFVFAALVWKEMAADEREADHIQKAGRISFLVGSSILVIGVLWQAIRHDIDPWLLFALSGMVLSKLLARLYQRYRN